MTKQATSKQAAPDPEPELTPAARAVVQLRDLVAAFVITDREPTEGDRDLLAQILGAAENTARRITENHATGSTSGDLVDAARKFVKLARGSTVIPASFGAFEKALLQDSAIRGQLVKIASQVAGLAPRVIESCRERDAFDAGRERDALRAIELGFEDADLGPILRAAERMVTAPLVDRRIPQWRLNALECLTAALLAVREEKVAETPELRELHTSLALFGPNLDNFLAARRNNK